MAKLVGTKHESTFTFELTEQEAKYLFDLIASTDASESVMDDVDLRLFDMFESSGLYGRSGVVINGGSAIPVEDRK